MRHISLFVLVFGLVAAPPAQAAETTRQIRAELPPAQAARFVVENLAGTMRIVPGKRAAVVAVATVHAESAELAEAVRFESVTTDRPDGETDMPTLRVRYPIESHSTLRYSGGTRTTILVLPKWLQDSCANEWLEGSGTKVNYDGHKVAVSSHGGVLLYADVEVQVPSREIEATFRNMFGMLEGHDVAGRIKFDTQSGGIGLQKLHGRIVADTGSGDVRADGIEGTLRCDTGSGNCRVGGFRGEELVCDTGSGDVTVHGVVAKRLRGDTGSGAIRVSESDLEEFVADTGSGDIEMEAKSTARLLSIKADTGSGDVTLRLGPAASFEAKVDQGSGEIRNSYLDAVPILRRKELLGYRRGDGRIRISVDTGSGDLTLAPGPVSEDRDRPGETGSSRIR